MKKIKMNFLILNKELKMILMSILLDKTFQFINPNANYKY
jgi:hypothetical protein